MKFTKILGVAAVAALALMAFASTASATTLEVTGVTKNEPVSISASVAGSISLTGPFGELINTCTVSNVSGATTTPFSATRVGGPISSLTFETCTRDKESKVKVDNAGYLTVEAIAGTTNGTVFSDSAEVTTPSPIGILNCKTAPTGTHIGVLTGVASGTGTMHINASLNCSGLTGHWVGTYNVTTHGIGVE